MNATLVLHDFRKPILVQDAERQREAERAEVIAALSASPKYVPSKLFYDIEGSALFERITELPEYYLTRTEIAIFSEHISEISRAIGPKAVVVEFGSGAGTKTRTLLEHLDKPVAYVPIEINCDQLLEASQNLGQLFPNIDIVPVCADYTDYYELPPIGEASERTVIFFPGSTIGNFPPEEAIGFLERARSVVGNAGQLLIGVDLKKDRATIEAAYNDAAGVTAEFNRNILQHIATLFDSEIDSSSFGHLAFYNPDFGRIEMHLISHRDQVLKLGDTRIELAAGEHIVTEYSYKYELDQFGSMLGAAGWSIEHTWTDIDNRFAVCLAKVNR
jgi:L-histidine N-alpha-methyltransferase